MPDLWLDGSMNLAFWEWGPSYTIVPGRHIGLDQGPVPGGQPWDVPALRPGVVERSIQTDAIGRVVVVDTGRSSRRYISYCHGFYGDPSYEGDFLGTSDRVMRLARAWESPGSAWGGVHCHVVVHDKPGGAYLLGQRDTYYDPAVEIAEYVTRTAGDSARPFEPPVIPPTGVPDMILFNGITNPDQYYIGTYEGRRLKVRPTLGIESKVLLNSEPRLPRAQVTDEQLIDLCAQGGYVWDAENERGLYDGSPTY